jgi:hypothetical protein
MNTTFQAHSTYPKTDPALMMHMRRALKDRWLGNVHLLNDDAVVRQFLALGMSFDECFELKDGNGTPLAQMPYTAVVAGRRPRHGVTDDRGRTERFETSGPGEVRVFIGHRDLDGLGQ